jgi:hypothetical protein
MRKILALSVLTALFCVSLGSADLVTPRKLDPNEKIAPMSVRSYVAAFKASERARAIVSGRGQTCMGLYVFDAQGNCLAKDDMTVPKVCDDLNVEWIPPVEGRCSVEIRNLGHDVNEYQLNIR